MNKHLNIHRKREILKAAGPEFLKTIEINPSLMVHLIEKDVILPHESKDILALQEPSKQCYKLLEHLNSASVKQFIQFCIILHDYTKRPDIVETVFHLDINQLRLQAGNSQNPSEATPEAGCSVSPAQGDDTADTSTNRKSSQYKPHYYKRIETSESNEMLQISNDLLPGLLQHCGCYNRTLLKSSLFGRKETKPIDITKVYVRTKAQCWKNQRTCEDIGKMDLFLALFQRHPPNSLSLEGPPGAGKSSFMQDYAYEWSMDITSCEQSLKMGEKVQCQGHTWKLVLYIPVGCIGSSFIDAIKANIKCDNPKLKDQMMAAIEGDGEGVLIIGDGIDELRNQASIESICDFTKTSQEMVGHPPTVFISARNGLLSIPRQHFDRQLHIKGFSVEQGVEYMEKYFKEIYGITDHCVLDHARTHVAELRWVLINPLQVHIFSELTASGFLTLDDVDTLTTVKLFRCLDHHMVARDEECRGVDVSSADFYRVCLKCLLTNKRQITEDEISRGSPYLSLLTKCTYKDQNYKECHTFSFPHEMVFEYFAMRGLLDHIKSNPENKKFLLLSLCSNQNMWNVLQMACGFITLYERELFPDTVVAIIRCCLRLQTKVEPCVKNELTVELPELQQQIKESFPKDILSCGLTPEQITKVDRMYALIQDMFVRKADGCLKSYGWVLTSTKEQFWGAIRGNPFHKFIFSCLEQCAQEERAEICMKTTHHLLPCAMHDQQPNYSSFLRPVNGRYASATSRGKTILEIRVDCPHDLAPTLQSPNQLVDLQEKDDDRYSQLEIKKLNLASQYETFTLWVNSTASVVRPPEGGWSAGEWIPALEALLQQYKLQIVNIHPGPHLALSGLLSACQEVILLGETLPGSLGIMLGKVPEKDILQFVEWAHRVGLKARLGDLRVVLAAERDPELWQDVDSIIRQKIFFEAAYRPTYVTSSGKVLCEKYKPKRKFKVE